MTEWKFRPSQQRGDKVLTPYTDDPAKGMALAEDAAALAGIPLLQSKNLEQDLPQARTMIYLTQSEGLGSGILLAMAYGVTVIATRTGGIPELIDDGVTGIAFTKRTPNRSRTRCGNSTRSDVRKIGSRRPRSRSQPFHGRSVHGEGDSRFLSKGAE